MKGMSYFQADSNVNKVDGSVERRKEKTSGPVRGNGKVVALIDKNMVLK